MEIYYSSCVTDRLANVMYKTFPNLPEYIFMLPTYLILCFQIISIRFWLIPFELYLCERESNCS